MQRCIFAYITLRHSRVYFFPATDRDTWIGTTTPGESRTEIIDSSEQLCLFLCDGRLEIPTCSLLVVVIVPCSRYIQYWKGGVIGSVTQMRSQIYPLYYRLTARMSNILIKLKFVLNVVLCIGNIVIKNFRL